jgi:DNA-binding NtrC family response regulator
MLQDFNDRLHFILAIDDEPQVLTSIKDMLRSNSRIIVDTCTSATTAISLIRKYPRKYAVVLVDYLLPEMTGAELNRELLKINSDLVIAMHSGDTTRDALRKSLQAGAVDYLEKGISGHEFRAKIASFCKKYEEVIRSFEEPLTLTEAEEHIKSIGMCGASPEMLSVANQVMAAARTNSNVIITGPSGTGKELVAKAIHNLSDRKNYNFIPVNMGAISRELFESQMF